MKKLTLTAGIIILLFGATQKASAQYYFYDNNYYDNPFTYEIGGSIGIMNCLTDIGGRKGVGKKFIKDLNMGKTKFAGGIFVNAMYKYAVGLRLEGTFGQITADDKVLQSVKASTFGRYERNLSFRTNITEFMALAELHPLFIFRSYSDEYDRDPPRYSPYLLAGVGFFNFNPQAKLGNNWVDLQPLRTEGQGFSQQYPERQPYKLNQMNIPLGIGVKYELSSMINLRAEFVYRKLSTDYLDDVSTTYIDPVEFQTLSGFSGAKLTNALLLNDRQYELDPTHITVAGDQRGNPKNNDAYFTFNIKASLIFGRERVKR
jgi:hypothetical protein